MKYLISFFLILNYCNSFADSEPSKDNTIEIEIIDYLGEEQSHLVLTVPAFRKALDEDLGEPTKANAEILDSLVLKLKDMSKVNNQLESNLSKDTLGIGIVSRVYSGCGFHQYSFKQVNCTSQKCVIGFEYKSNDTCEANKPQFIFIPLDSFSIKPSEFSGKEILIKQLN